MSFATNGTGVSDPSRQEVLSGSCLCRNGKRSRAQGDKSIAKSKLSPGFAFALELLAGGVKLPTRR